LIRIRSIATSALLISFVAASLTPGLAATERSAAAVLAFKRHHPCPSTGLRRGSCPGWQVDHKIPLCLDGPDTPANMQWLTVRDHRAKTKQDIRSCKAYKHLKQNPL
jgi:hypothetical protein